MGWGLVWLHLLKHLPPICTPFPDPAPHLSFYRVTVSKTSSIAPIGQTSGSYWSNQAQFDMNGYYVLYDDASSVGNTTIPLSFSQTATSRTYNGAPYSVVAPVTPGTYYLVVFLYSGVVSVFYLLPIIIVYYLLTFPEPERVQH